MHLFFFFNDTATTEIYTLSLHDALPISVLSDRWDGLDELFEPEREIILADSTADVVQRLQSSDRSEEHTSELQSRQYLVCRLLLEKKKQFNSRIRLDI